MIFKSELDLKSYCFLKSTKQRYKDRNVAWAGIAAWLPHVRCIYVASYGDTFHRQRVSGMKAKITPHCANYLSVLSTFIKSSNIIPVLDTDCRLKTIFSTFQLSVVLAWWSCLGRSIIPWPTVKTKFKICTNLLTYFAFQPQHRESESDTIIIRAARPQPAPVTQSSWQYLWQNYINDTEKFHG